MLSILLERLYELKGDQPNELSVMGLTNNAQVQTFINSNTKATFDITLLDRDCKLNKSFHNLDIEWFGPGKIISLSAVPEYNEDAKKARCDQGRF